MLNRDDFAQRFGPRAVFGVVHLLPLPGAPMFEGSMDQVVDAALRDARAIAEGGCDGFLVENFGDRPFFATAVPNVTVCAMTRVISEILRSVRMPFGVNVLRNDPDASLAIAAATGAAFIRVNVHTGSMLTDQGLIEGRAAATLRERERIARETFIFADHLVKHAVPVAAIDVLQAAKDLRHRGLADAIIVTGTETGAAPAAHSFREVGGATDAPIVIGSGVTPENAGDFAGADAAIVGTSLKVDGKVENPVEKSRVVSVVRAFKSS